MYVSYFSNKFIYKHFFSLFMTTDQTPSAGEDHDMQLKAPG